MIDNKKADDNERMSPVQVLFISTEKRVDEYLGIGYLSSALAAHGIGSRSFQWELAEAREKVEDLLRHKPEICLVGIPWLYIFSEPHAIRLARWIKQLRPDVKIVVGGHPATFEYKRILQTYEEIDFVIRGEGDVSIVELFNAVLERRDFSSIKGIAFRAANGEVVATPPRSQIADIDNLPFPRRDTLEQVMRSQKKSDILVRMIGSRGCYAQCEFCSMVSFYSIDGTKMSWRPRTAENIVEELIELTDKYKVRNFWFADDEFIGPPKIGIERLIRLAELICRNGLNIEYGFDARANGITAFSLDQLKILYKSGLRVVAMGLESGSQNALNRINKGMRVATNFDAIKMLRAAGIDYRYGFIMYDEQTTLSDLYENVEFLRFAEPHKICNTGPFRLLNAEFPEVGTPLFRKLGLETHTVDIDVIQDFPRLDEEQLGYKFANPAVSKYRRILLKFASEVVEPKMIPRSNNTSTLRDDVWFGINSLPQNINVMQAFLECHKWLLNNIEDYPLNEKKLFVNLTEQFHQALLNKLTEKPEVTV